MESQPFDFYFLDTAFDRLYRREQRTGEIFSVFSFVAILIAVLGLYGLASFTVERRTKEIGIRRIMGASGFAIVSMLSREFLKLVILATFIAWPLAYLYANDWIGNFTYHSGFDPLTFLAPALAALVICVFTISFQTIRAASSNPVETLRYE